MTAGAVVPLLGAPGAKCLDCGEGIEQIEYVEDVALRRTGGGANAKVERGTLAILRPCGCVWSLKRVP